MLLSAVSVLVVAQSSSEIPEALMNNPVFISDYLALHSFVSFQNIKFFENKILFYETVYKDSSVRFSKCVIT